MISNLEDNSKERRLLNLQESINFSQKVMCSIRTPDCTIKSDGTDFDNNLIEIKKLKTQQVNDILYNPIFASQIKSSTVLIELDLSKTNEALKKGFKKVLENIRKVNHYDNSIAKSTTEAKIDNMMKAKVFEYIDVLYWIKFKELDYSEQQIANIIFSTGTNLQKLNRLKSTTKKNVNKLMNVKFIQKLKQEIIKG